MRTLLRTALPALLALLGLLALVAPGTAEQLVTSLSTHRVAITSTYTGSQVVVFGAVERDAQTIARATGYDVVVTVRGPRELLTVRQKERLGPIWINREQRKFVNLPAYLGVYSSAPLGEITTDILRRRLRIGIEAVVFDPQVTRDPGDANDPYRRALIRLKRAENLFLEVERGVTFLTPSIFRAPITLPATAPPGNYEVEVALFADDILLARDHTNFELVKTGFEQRIAALAADMSLVYGIATALVALFFGWIATVIFRRD